MVIEGEKAAAFIFSLHGKGQIQPCGIDLTVREIHEFEGAGEIDFSNAKRRISKTSPMSFSKGGKIFLKCGSYKIIYNEHVKVPEDCCAFGFPRSSLLRCGADVRCAVWDAGYEGRSESLLVVHSKHGLLLHKNAKVAQLVFVRLEGKAKAYRGRYLKENL